MKQLKGAPGSTLSIHLLKSTSTSHTHSSIPSLLASRDPVFAVPRLSSALLLEIVPRAGWRRDSKDSNSNTAYEQHLHFNTPTLQHCLYISASRHAFLKLSNICAIRPCVLSQTSERSDRAVYCLEKHQHSRLAGNSTPHHYGTPTLIFSLQHIHAAVGSA